MTLYEATPTQVGLTLGAYNLGGFIASLVIPTAADRTGDYLRPLLICGVCGVAMVIVLALTTSLPFALLALVLLGGPPGVGSTLLFAQLRHDGASPSRVIRTRAIVSFAWVVGPPLATACTGLFGSSSALLLLAGIGLVNIATTVLLLRSRSCRLIEPKPLTSRPSILAQLRGWGRWGVVIAFLTLQVTNIATVTVVTLFVTRELQAPPLWAGIVLGTAALFEIPSLLLIGWLHTRLSARALILISCFVGALLLISGRHPGSVAARRAAAAERLVLRDCRRCRTDGFSRHFPESRFGVRPFHQHTSRWRRAFGPAHHGFSQLSRRLQSRLRSSSDPRGSSPRRLLGDLLHLVA